MKLNNKTHIAKVHCRKTYTGNNIDIFVQFAPKDKDFSRKLPTKFNRHYFTDFGERFIFHVGTTSLKNRNKNIRSQYLRAAINDVIDFQEGKTFNVR